MTDASTPQLSISELVKLAAVDNEIYARTFFPRTFRQASPSFQKEIWRDLDDPSVRNSNQRIYRGAAKTTISRVFSSKRIAYGMSKTILYVGASEGSAARSGAWLRNNVERNKLWAGTFKIRPGRKWTDTEFEIEHETLQDHIWCQFVGITGNIRGINFDDYRPDLIVLDDILTDENCATLEQRDKVTKLVNGALKRSLAPVVDDPNAKIAMLVTPQHVEDASSVAKKDPTWKTLEFGCWTEETKFLPVTQQVSRWEERFPTEDLRKEKLAAIEINQLSTFTKEMEVRLTSPELAAFRGEWLKFNIVPGRVENCFNVLSIDPTPPPSDAQLAKGFIGDDFEVIHVWGRRGDNYYLQERRASRGETPDWTVANAFELAMKYRVGLIVVESVAYQRTLKWLIEKEMARRRQYYQILPFVGGNKYAGIRNAFAGLASHGHVWVRPEDTPFIEQFTTWPSSDHDDELDAARIALGALINPFAAAGSDENSLAEVESFGDYRGAP
jgi:phage terminase large subunit-like protein